MNRNTFDEITEEQTFDIISSERSDGWPTVLRAYSLHEGEKTNGSERVPTGISL
jgi:hypothetical protein